MADKNATKKRILVIGTDELNEVLDRVNTGLKNYTLVGLPCVLDSTENIARKELDNNYDGVLVDELNLESLNYAETSGKKVGIGFVEILNDNR